VTAGRDPSLRQRLRAVLMSDPEIAPRICQLSAMFGYNQAAECSQFGWEASKGGSKGSSQGGQGPERRSGLEAVAGAADTAAVTAEEAGEAGDASQDGDSWQAEAAAVEAAADYSGDGASADGVDDSLRH